MAAANVSDKGIRCPNCGCAHHYTIRTRPAPRNRIMRIRKCRNCGRQLITYEAAAGVAIDEMHPDDLNPSQREGWITRLMELAGLRP